MATYGIIDGVCEGTEASKYNVWLIWEVLEQSSRYNNSTIRIRLYLQRNDGEPNSAYDLSKRNPVNLEINNTMKVDKVISIDTRNSEIALLASWEGALGHDSEGKLSLGIDAYFSMPYLETLWLGRVIVDWVELPTIDRTEPSVVLSIVDNITTNSLRIIANAHKSCNLWQYSLNGGQSGSWVTFKTAVSTSASHTITGLSPHTTYNLVVRARRADNYLYGYSYEEPTTTVGRSTLNSVSSFAADASTVIINTNITCANAEFVHDLEIKEGTYTVLTITGFLVPSGKGNKSFTLTSSQRSTLLQHMNTRKSFVATLNLKTYDASYQSLIGTSDKTAAVTTSAALSAPTFTDFTYYDNNPLTPGITGNGQIQIQGYSSLYVTYNVATAKNRATIKNYTATIGDITKSSTSTNINIGNLSTAGDQPLTVTVTDSRGYSKSITKTVKVLPYEKPVIESITARRQNSIGETIELSFNGSISSLIVGSTEKNYINDIRYRYKRTDQDNFGYYSSIKAACQIDGLEFSYSSSYAFTLDTDYSYNFEIEIRDALGDVAFYVLPLTIPKGTPDVSIRRGKIGIHNPDPQSTLDVGGTVRMNGQNVMGFIRQISTDGENFNDIVETGYYVYYLLPSDTQSTNLPTGANHHGILEVFGGSGLIDLQRYTDSNKKIYIRNRVLGGSWNSWAQIN